MSSERERLTFAWRVPTFADRNETSKMSAGRGGEIDFVAFTECKHVYNVYNVHNLHGRFYRTLQDVTGFCMRAIIGRSSDQT